MEKNKNLEAYNKIRKDWGDIKPVTKVIQSKKAYSRKQKHKAESFIV